MEIHTASTSSFLQTWQKARAGIPPGSGNAGAMPLDYLLLRGWLTLGTRPPISAIEGYFRVPSMVWSTCSVIALYLYALRYFGLPIALLAGGLLATSVPHIAYAAEVRPYSLMSLTSVLTLWGFSAVLAAASVRTWLAYTASAAIAFLSGIPSLFLLAAQYAVLLVKLGAESVRARRYATLLGLLASAAVLSGIVLWYYHGSVVLSASYGRPHARLSPSLTFDALLTFAQESRVLLWLFFASLPIVVLRGWHRGPADLAIALGLVASFLAIPAMIELARWKEYYFHPRHVVLLLPYFALVTAVGIYASLAWLCARLTAGGAAAPARNLVPMIAGIVAIAALQGPALRDFIVRPEPSFGWSKTQRDFAGLMEVLRARTAKFAPGERYLLIAEARHPGRIGNPTLAKYLQWYGLYWKVALHGTENPDQTLLEMQRLCPDGCRGDSLRTVQRSFAIRDPFGVRIEFRRLLGLAPTARPGTTRVGGMGVLFYDRPDGGGAPRGHAFALTRRHGLALVEVHGGTAPAPASRSPALPSAAPAAPAATAPDRPSAALSAPAPLASHGAS